MSLFRRGKKRDKGAGKGAKGTAPPTPQLVRGDSTESGVSSVPSSRSEPLPIHTAAERGILDDVRKNLNRGVDVNELDASGWTPLLCAANEAPSSLAVYVGGWLMGWLVGWSGRNAGNACPTAHGGRPPGRFHPNRDENHPSVGMIWAKSS